MERGTCYGYEHPGALALKTMKNVRSQIDHAIRAEFILHKKGSAHYVMVNEVNSALEPLYLFVFNEILGCFKTTEFIYVPLNWYWRNP